VNRGDDDRLRVGDGRTAYLKFDLSAVSPGSVDGAQLRLFVEQETALAVEIRAVADTSWSEDTLTHQNRPATGEIVTTVRPDRTGFVDIDLTSFVAVRSGSLVTLALVAPDAADLRISSTEGPHAPTLVIS
jgi:hypothetical protein